MDKKYIYIGLGVLAIGGLLWYMKRKNPSDSTFDGFNANGGDKDRQQYKFSGKGVVLVGAENNANFRKADTQSLLGQNIIATADMTKPFTLKGMTKKLVRSSDPNLANANVYIVSDSPNATEYVKTSLFWTLQTNRTEYWSVWIPKESIIKI